MDLLLNYPLISALVAIFFAQAVKVPLEFLATRKFDVCLAFSTGGMPSSHSAAVTSLATAVGISEGFSSPFFAISFVLAVIVMFDATGVRRHAGEQAIAINRLVEDWNTFMSEAKKWPKKEQQEKQQKLKELLGHQPIEVFFGALTGIIIAIIMYGIYNL
ncbi:divergent PAP2 family protein [Priestia endophytica]|jgi:acid phosphatase family membrane protein YuiD|uniref:divergent PAP2 family protein n=1 Tax=Priestia endophytica TaxID=135735 RepID=UPI00203C5D6B|nr:divergent PAP2 family protein [Priestia endophytica]MCM3540069.1 divergent PAP2 family protein [Priestia endophytica]